MVRRAILELNGATTEATTGTTTAATMEQIFHE
jgi:hypothetical protein